MGSDIEAVVKTAQRKQQPAAKVPKRTVKRNNVLVLRREKLVKRSLASASNCGWNLFRRQTIILTKRSRPHDHADSRQSFLSGCAASVPNICTRNWAVSFYQPSTNEAASEGRLQILPVRASEP